MDELNDRKKVSEKFRRFEQLLHVHGSITQCVDLFLLKQHNERTLRNDGADDVVKSEHAYNDKRPKPNQSSFLHLFFQRCE